MLHKTRDVKIYDNDTVSALDTYDINAYDLNRIEFYGTATGSSASFSVQRSMDNTNFYTTDAVIVTGTSDFYGQFQVLAPYVRIVWNGNYTGVTMVMSASTTA